VIRFGCALQLRAQAGDHASLIYARCAVARQHGLRIVRIPAMLATPLPRHAIPYLREYIAQQQLRLVVHAPFAHIHQLITDCGSWVALFEQLACDDAVIICHVPQLDTSTASHFQRITPAIRRYLALEHTHQAPDVFGQFAAHVNIPPIFDWQHYHHIAPWPYAPDRTLCEWASRWGQRRPLWHMSSASEHGTPTRHGATVDSSVVVWLVRSMCAAGYACDIEIESHAGIAAYMRLRREIQQKAPELAHYIHEGDTHART
jgi:hypothetical protein